MIYIRCTRRAGKCARIQPYNIVLGLSITYNMEDNAMKKGVNRERSKQKTFLCLNLGNRSGCGNETEGSAKY